MSSFVDSLNLRPQEKRLIVGIAVVAFVVLNYLFVIPHFQDYARMKREWGNILHTNQIFSAEIAADNPTNGYRWKLEQLRKGGSDASALRFSTAIQLQTTVAKQAQEAGVSVQTYDPVNPVHLSTNASQFFESESIRISVEANEDSLVNFLYNVGNDPAMIRVREYDLHPVDANRYKLKGQITLTADYKKSDKDAVAKLMAAKNVAPTPSVAKVTPVAPQKTVAPTNPPPNGRGPGAELPPARGMRGDNRGPFLPGQKPLNPNGRGQSVPVAPPQFPTIPPRRPPSGQPPPATGNNQ